MCIREARLKGPKQITGTSITKGIRVTLNTYKGLFKIVVLDFVYCLGLLSQSLDLGLMETAGPLHDRSEYTYFLDAV
jgi:hypothetical protein